MKSFLVGVIAALWVGGCASDQRDAKYSILRQVYLEPQSAEATGCPLKDMNISRYRPDHGVFGGDVPTWVATCHHRTYQCTGGREVSCREAIEEF